MNAILINGKILLNAQADISMVKEVLARYQIITEPEGAYLILNMEEADLDPTELLMDLNNLPKGCFASGELDFSGSDRKTMFDYRFRLIYLSDVRLWKLENAVFKYPVVSSHSQRLEFLGELVDIVEDFLEENNIDIPNDEKEKDDCAPIIYGTDYDKLSRAFEDFLIRCGILDEEVHYDA